jgi:uncharacterized membrane protein
VTNRRYFATGVALSVAAMAAAGFMQSTAGPAEAGFNTVFTLFMVVWLTFWSLGVTFLLGTAVLMWRAALAKDEKAKGASVGAAVFLSLFSIPFVMGEIAGISMLGASTSGGMIALLAVVVAVNAVFYHILKAYTYVGRRFMDRVEGFKQFLAAVEQDRLKVLHPPEKTPELFERFLPYALALGVEQKWAEQFTEVLQRAQAAAGSAAGYTPRWYSGPSWNAGAAPRFASSLGGAFSMAVASSSSAPGSSSGGGGGGSSGGGGGGGGGGGW